MGTQKRLSLDPQVFRALLRELGMNQVGLAQELDFHPQTVTNWKAEGFPYWVGVYLRARVDQEKLRRISSHVRAILDEI